MNQWELEANTHNRRLARENACDQVAICFRFASDWLRKWRDFILNQSQIVVKQTHSNSAITFDTQLKTALKGESVNDDNCMRCSYFLRVFLL